MLLLSLLVSFEKCCVSTATNSGCQLASNVKFVDTDIFNGSKFFLGNPAT